MRLLRQLALISVSLLSATGSMASAQDWPAHPVTLVVPWAAGGGTDVMARLLAPPMSEVLGQRFIIENISGAGGMVGSSLVARANPDGYTLDFGSRSDAVNMTLYKHPTFSLKDDLDPVVLVADQPTLLVTRADLPPDGLQSFIAYLKKNASIIKMGSGGVGSTSTIDCAIFAGKIGVDIQAIPYRGSGPAMQDLIGRQFDFLCAISGTAVAPLQNGQVKGIAVFRQTRLPSVPNLPTSFEQGMDFDASSWFGFFVPKGTPAAIIEKLHDAAVVAMELPAVQEQLAANGTYVVPPEHRSTDYFKGMIVPEIEKSGAPLRAAGMSVD